MEKIKKVLGFLVKNPKVTLAISFIFMALFFASLLGVI